MTQRQLDEHYRELYQKTFLAKATQTEAIMVLQDILWSLKVFQTLKSPEDLVLHNAAMMILDKLGYIFELDPRNKNVVKLAIDEDLEQKTYPDEVRDERMA